MKHKTKLVIPIALIFVCLGIIVIAMGNFFGALFFLVAWMVIIIPHLPEVINWFLGGLSDSDAGNKRMCVKCGRQIPFDANICPYCGHDFS